MTTKSSLLQKYPLDFWVCGVILLASAFLFASSRDLPDKAVLFPSIMLVCMMGLSAYCMGASVLRQRKKAAKGGLSAPSTPIDLKAVFVLGAMTAAYAFVTPYIGFGLSSLIFIASGTVFFGERNKLAVAAIPVVVMAFVYAFFIYFLDVSIPFFPDFAA